MKSTTRTPPHPRRAAAALAAALILGTCGLFAQAPGASFAGRPLADALAELQARGLEVFFTSNLVRPEMRVTAEPGSTDLRAILGELLTPHGLAAEIGPGGRLVIVAAEPRAKGEVRGRVEPLAGVIAIDEIVVTPSRVSLLSTEPVNGLDLDRDDIFALPHLADDIFRAFTLLPGVSGEETSARFSVRGGRTDEVLVLLDRVELFEPYHMKDFSSSLSIITPRALREVNLITGGFPAEYGDRMSGVLDMATVEPTQRRTHIGVSILNAEVGSSGTFGDGRGQWLGSLRRGSLDLTLDFFGEKQQPQFWDTVSKLEYQLQPGQRLGAHVLHSDDKLDFFNIDPDTVEDYVTGYGNSYVWLVHQAIVGSRLFFGTTASFGRVDRDRRGREVDTEVETEGNGFSLIDKRRLDVTGLKQDWQFQARGTQQASHYLKWGFGARRLETDYDYLNLRELDDPLADYRTVPRSGTTRFLQSLKSEQHSAYLSDRVRFSGKLTVELGLRYDEHTLARDRNLSPRFNLVWALGRAGTLRAAWGYFHQSQRPYELQVEDGVTTPVSAERTEQRVIGFERSFATGGSDLLLRVEAYQRRVRDPRPRFENLYEQISIFPEIEADRFLIAPQASAAYGLEISVRGGLGERVGWWASYVYSRVEDCLDGRDVPRRIDQPHALNLVLNYRAGKHWNVNLAWRFHSGWPTTAVSGRAVEDDEGEIETVPVLGPLYAERLPVYHRLDLRASREWAVRRGVIGFFIDVQNLYDRRNVAGFDVDFNYEQQEDGSIQVIAAEEIWGYILPSFGVTWEL